MPSKPLAERPAPLPSGEWLGPLFYYELVRVGRRGRYFLLRFGYALFLLLVVTVAFAAYFDHYDPWKLLTQPALRLAQQTVTALTDHIVVLILIVQAVALAILAPACVAGTVADERHRGTLELLFTTHLTDWEIVCGKLASRLVLLFTVWLAGLPLLALMQLWGGVNFQTVLLSFLATGAWVLLVAAISISASVQQQTTGMAFAHAYVITLPLTGVAALVFAPFLSLATAQAMPLLLLVSTGPVIIAGATLRSSCHQLRTVAARQPSSDVLLTIRGPGKKLQVQMNQPARALNPPLTDVPTAVPQVSRPVEPTPAPVLLDVEFHRQPPPKLPRVGRDAILWKERFLGVGIPAETVIEGVSALSISIVGALLVVLLVGALHVSHLVTKDFEALLVLAKVLLIVPSFVLLGVLFYSAARCIVTELEGRTLVSLLMLPYSRQELLWLKWKGIVLRYWAETRLLVLVAAAAVVLALLHPSSVAVFLVLLLSQVAFVLSLGLFVSCQARTTFHANIFVIVILLLAFLEWAMLPHDPPRTFVQGSDRLGVTFLFSLFNPLGSWWWLLQPWPAWSFAPGPESRWCMWEQFMPLAGAAVYGLSAWVLFRLSVRALEFRFSK